MNAVERFWAASRERDVDAAVVELAPDVVMFNPASDEPLIGREAVAHWPMANGLPRADLLGAPAQRQRRIRGTRRVGSGKSGYRQHMDLEQIDEWVGAAVVDSDGQRFGRLEELYYAVWTGQPVFAIIRRGIVLRHYSVVALAGATVGPGYVRLAYQAQHIDRAGGLSSGSDPSDPRFAEQVGVAYGVELPVRELESATAIRAQRMAARRGTAARRDREGASRADASSRAGFGGALRSGEWRLGGRP
ncbi:MAG: hypothetical protein ACYDA6_07180 [Solirubrobacteraceae bacterium]